MGITKWDLLGWCCSMVLRDRSGVSHEWSNVPSSSLGQKRGGMILRPMREYECPFPQIQRLDCWHWFVWGFVRCSKSRVFTFVFGVLRRRWIMGFILLAISYPIFLDRWAILIPILPIFNYKSDPSYVCLGGLQLRSKRFTLLCDVDSSQWQPQRGKQRQWQPWTAENFVYHGFCLFQHELAEMMSWLREFVWLRS